MQTVYLNIGSNKGDRHANIERAVALIIDSPYLKQGRVRKSPYFYSNPEGFVSDNKFVNIGIAIDFADKMPVTPLQLLTILQQIEKEIGPDSPHRHSDGTYCDRIVDIDIIDIEGVKIQSEELTVPHPRAGARQFVLQPMAFLAPNWHFNPFSDKLKSNNKKSIDELGRDSIEAFKNKKKLPLTLVLDNIRSLNNVGSIFRSADAFCINKIYLCGITGTPPSQEINKTALGAEDSVDWIYCNDVLEAILSLKKEGLTIACLEQVHNSVMLNEFVPDANKNYALIVGNEVNGVDQKAVDLSDICLEIPQDGTKHSLNVAVSAALAMWHFFSTLR